MAPTLILMIQSADEEITQKRVIELSNVGILMTLTISVSSKPSLSQSCPLSVSVPVLRHLLLVRGEMDARWGNSNERADWD